MKKRNEIEEKYKWNLKTIYKDENEFNRDYENIKFKVEDFEKNSEDFILNVNNFYNTLKEYYDINIILEKLYTYVSHYYDEDISNSKALALKDKVYDLYTEFSKVSSFISPKILMLDRKKIDRFYNENPKLKEDYGFIIENIFREKPHTLSLKEEKVISSLSNAYGDTSSIAGMLSDADIDFGYIKDENGNDVHLTDTSYQTYILSKDRNVRKNAFQTLYKSYKQFNNTFALTLSAEVKKNKAFAKVRKFDNSLTSALFNDNVPVTVYTNLIDTISKNLKPLYKYYDLKKNVLNLKEMHLYDTYVEIADMETKKYSFDEAKDLVIDALSILGDDYVTNLKRAFDERWIDIYPNENKRGGAYSGGSYLTNPFVLLNFNGTYHDVSTLAHELGHSMHTYYSNLYNKYQYSQYSIFVAEVASQVNELLLNNYMLEKAKTKEEKINILNQILELFKASIYRQTMFAEFEKLISEEETLTTDNLNEIYYDLVKKYFGENVFIDEEIKYEWERIPHFYYNFYVYKYSLGLAAATYIVKRILNNEEGAKDNYLKFLKMGGSNYPLEELKVAGVDLEDSSVIQSATDMFEFYLEELKKLI